MGGLDRRIGKRQRHHARGHLRTERRDARGPRLVVQEAVDAFLHEPFLPAPDAGLRLAGPAHDLVGANTVGARENDRRPPSVFLRGVTVPGDRFKSAAGARPSGPRGDAGATGVTICDWKIDRASYVATPVMSDAAMGPPLSCAGCLSNFCAR